ncbi:MAG: DNA translocase FtsK [Defluviitaleaceae bacterium]|nr:DNA translocase FtsK [Defluviitaleaceae bacterium]
MPRKVSTPPKSAPGSKKETLIHNEVKYLSLSAAGFLLLLAVLLPDNMGGIGNFFRGFLFGFFGYGAFVLPVGILAVAVCRLIAREVVLPVVKIIATFWLILSLLHIFVFNRETDDFIFFEVYRAGLESGGGIFGMLIGGSLSALLGVGAPIAIIVAIVILVILITGRSFVNFLGNGVGKARDYYEESRHYYEEEDDDVPDNIIPVRPPRKKDKKSNIIDLEQSYEPESPGKIMLINEELEKRKQPNPLFAERKPVIADDLNKRSAVISFPATIVGDSFDSYVEEEPLDELPDEPMYESDDESPDDLSDELADEFEVLPVSEGPIVKGLIDGVGEEEPVPPLFADDDDDMLDYDEYAQAGRATAPSTPIAKQHTYEDYQLPSLSLLSKNERPSISAESRTQVLENSRILEETLRSFRIEAKVVEVSVGPTVTRYDLAPGPGVKVSSIANLSNDLALSLAAQGLRIEAPVPGKSAVGIEIPNKEAQGVFLREILEDERFVNFPSKLSFAVGKDIAGSPIITDIARMPHLLIAGATGSGKSVCINTLITSLLYKSRPDEVKLLMIDPKVVELSVYNGIPHLLIPVVTDPKKASGALSWAVAEMETRYNMFAETGCRDLKGYNKYAKNNGDNELPLIVIIIDELADLMMTCKGEVEESICRLAQKARAAGIHLVVATQRPSVDVITGLIKANIPSRLAFAVSSGTDSRTVLDMYGAEKLLGKGDMLFLPMGQNKPIRVQGGFISDGEVEGLVNFLKAQAPEVEQSPEDIQRITMPGKVVPEGEVDEFFHDAVEFLLAKGKGSTSMLQRQFRIGYNRASRLMDDLQARGIVGPEDGVKPRKVTITREEYRELYGR